MSDSLTYEQFRVMIANLDVEQYRMVDDDVFVPSMVLVGTAMVNSYIIMNYGLSHREFTIRATTCIFIAGGVLSCIIYFIRKCTQ